MPLRDTLDLYTNEDDDEFRERAHRYLVCKNLCHIKTITWLCTGAGFSGFVSRPHIYRRRIRHQRRHNRVVHCSGCDEEVDSVDPLRDPLPTRTQIALLDTIRHRLLFDTGTYCCAQSTLHGHSDSDDLWCDDGAHGAAVSGHARMSARVRRVSRWVGLRVYSKWTFIQRPLYVRTLLCLQVCSLHV